MNPDTLQIIASLFVINTETFYPPAKLAIFFLKSLSMVMYFPPLSISRQQSFYCDRAFVLASSRCTKNLLSLVWNKRVKSEQQNSLGHWHVCSEGRSVMLTSQTYDDPLGRHKSLFHTQPLWGGRLKAKTSVSQSLTSSIKSFHQ